MARRYYRSRVRYIKPKKRWASNISRQPFRVVNPIAAGVAPGVQQFGGSATVLVVNSPQGSNPTPTIIKTGNFKVQGNFNQIATSASTDYTFGCTLYIMYVPQGYDIANTNVLQSLIADHPEWIMTWSLLDTGNSNSTSLVKFSCSSRLKRNLNSGDRICAVFLSSLTFMGTTGTSSNISYTLTGDLECHYWTCAN